MTDLASRLAGLAWGRVTSPWDGHEAAHGYGVMSSPFASGDHLGLRVFPRTTFGGYVSIWHRDPAGDWRQYVSDAPVECGCPRQWGPALADAMAANIEVTWTGPMQLRVRMDEPALSWDLALEQTPALRLVNAVNRRLPLATWRTRWMVAVRERVARLLGLGPVAMSGTLPTDGRMVAALAQLCWIRSSTATLDGQDLGALVRLPSGPTIGGWPLPRRAVFAVGEAHATPGTAPPPPR